MAGLLDRAMVDILQKLEKGGWGSRVALNAPCIHGKLTNIQTNGQLVTNKSTDISNLKQEAI